MNYGDKFWFRNPAGLGRVIGTYISESVLNGELHYEAIANGTYHYVPARDVIGPVPPEAFKKTEG